MSDKQVKDYDKFVVRLPEGMREAIAERAKKNSRSMNSEIVQILQDALVSSAYDAFVTKENLEKMPDDIKRKMIISRTAQARIKMNESLREIEENLEILGINGDETLGEIATQWWKSHDAKTIKAISLKKWNKKPT